MFVVLSIGLIETIRWSISLKYNLFLFKQMEAKSTLELENKFNNIFKNTYDSIIIKTTECFEYNDKNLDITLQLLED